MRDKKKLCKKLVKVSSLRNNHNNKSSTRMASTMFHKITAIYKYLKHKETLKAALVIQNLRSPLKSWFSSPPHPDQPSESNLPENLQEVSPDLQYIQPSLSQVCNWDEIRFIKMKSGVIWFIPMIFSQVTGCRGPIMVKYHHYGAQHSYSFIMVDSFSSPQFWCTRPSTTVNISITKYPVLGLSTILHQDIWIDMGVLKPCLIYPLCDSLLHSITKCSSMMALAEILRKGHWTSFRVTTSKLLSWMQVFLYTISPTILIQILFSTKCMVMQELTGWGIMEPKISCQPTSIMSLLKVGKLWSWHPLLSPRMISRIHTFSLFPHHTNTKKKLSLKLLKRSKVRKWMRFNQ